MERIKNLTFPEYLAAYDELEDFLRMDADSLQELLPDKYTEYATEFRLFGSGNPPTMAEALAQFEEVLRKA